MEGECPSCNYATDHGVVVIHVRSDLLRGVVDMFNRAQMRDGAGCVVSIQVQSREYDYPNHVDLVSTLEWPE